MQWSELAGRLGRQNLTMLAQAGRLSRLTGQAVTTAFVAPFFGQRVRGAAALREVRRAGNRSLPLVALISLLVGMILALQSAYQLRPLGATRLVAGLVAVSVTRELAPLLTAILVAGRVGSAITAELATMRVSQEIDALTVMGIDPVGFLVVPRFFGLLVALPCLTVFADSLGILGGCGVGVAVLGLGATGYLADSLQSLVLQDLWGGVLKSLAFAGIIAVVGCQQGLDTRGGAEAVGRSTTASVVRSIVLVIFTDLFVTALLFAGR